MGGGNQPYDYRKEITQSLNQANMPKSPLSNAMSTYLGNAMPNLFSGLMNAQNLGNSVIGRAFTPAQMGQPTGNQNFGSQSPAAGFGSAPQYTGAGNNIPGGSYNPSAPGGYYAPPNPNAAYNFSPGGKTAQQLGGFNQQVPSSQPYDVSNITLSPERQQQLNDVLAQSPDNLKPYWEWAFRANQNPDGSYRNVMAENVPADLWGSIQDTDIGRGMMGNLPLSPTATYDPQKGGTPEGSYEYWTQLMRSQNPPNPEDQQYLYDNGFYNGNGGFLGTGPNSINNPNGELGVSPFGNPFTQVGSGGSGQSSANPYLGPQAAGLPGLDFSSIHGAINPQDSEFYKATEQSLANKQQRDIADLRARFGAGGGGSRGTSAMHEEAVLRSQQAPEIAQALGSVRQGEFANELGRRGLVQSGMMDRANLYGDLNKFNAGQTNQHNQFVMGANQSAIENQINRQFTGLQNLFQVLSQFGLSGIPGGSANVSLSPTTHAPNSAPGWLQGINGFLQGIGSIVPG